MCMYFFLIFFRTLIKYFRLLPLLARARRKGEHGDTLRKENIYLFFLFLVTKKEEIFGVFLFFLILL